MHIHFHPITFVAIYRGRDHYQRIFRNEIPDTPHTALVSSTLGFDVEFQCLGTGQEKEKAACGAQQRLGVHHAFGFWSFKIVVALDNLKGKPRERGTFFTYRDVGCTTLKALGTLVISKK